MGGLGDAPRRSTLFWAAVTLVVQIAYARWAYGFCTDLFFHFDDFWAIGDASKLEIHTPLDLWQFFKPNNGFLLYRPISMVAYFWALKELFGFDPRYYHVTQIGLVVLNSMLVFAVVQRVSGRAVVAAAGAIAYGLAPGHAIAACWNSLATAVLAATFYFAAVLRWLGPARHRTASTFVFFALALLSSEHGVTLPAALLLISLTILEADRRRADVRSLIPFLVISTLYVAAKMIYLRFFLRYDFPEPLQYMYVMSAYGTSLAPQVILTNLGYYVTYLAGPFYQLAPTDVAALHLGIGTLAACIVGAGWGLWRRRSDAAAQPVALGLGMFLIGIAPVLPLLAHRNAYYISIPGLGAAVVVASLGRRRAWTNIVLAAALAGTCVAVQLNGGLDRVRVGGDFNFMRGFTSTALLWVHMVYAHTQGAAVDTVYVRGNTITELVFKAGRMHKLLLCADYDVRMVPAGQPMPADTATSISLDDPVDAIPIERVLNRRWMHLRGCGAKPQTERR